MGKWTGLIWLRIGTCDGLLRTRHESSDLYFIPHKR